MQFKPLEVVDIPLVGQHLIEASAGTGKTYNITRIYLRLLLERKIPVENILVMTFTNDATEELRGRIDRVLRDALANWQTLCEQDTFFQQIAQRVPTEQAHALLHKALLFLDEAAIFTIHGFCQRMLKQHAFATGLTFNARLQKSDRDLVLEACQDWYRQLMLAKPADDFLLVANYWPTPEQFLTQFGQLLTVSTEVYAQSAEQIIVEFQQQVQQALQVLTVHQEQLFAWLVDNHKDKHLRGEEFQQLMSWLTEVAEDVQQVAKPMPANFIRAQRFGKRKEQISALLAPVLLVKQRSSSLINNINKAQAYLLVKQGVQQIRAQLLVNKQQLNVLNFDDLINVLANALKTEQQHHSTELSSRLVEQFPVALIDEFQDTDIQQFSILQAIYTNQAEAALYLIGDPKQAIYGFRGGDVFAYLGARYVCQYHWRMDTNWRSTAAMITGYNRLFYGDHLQAPAKPIFKFDIEYFPVTCAGQQNTASQLMADQYQALQFVHFVPPETEQQKLPLVVKAEYRAVLAMWCAQEIQRLLADFWGAEHTEALLKPNDIAILVRDGSEALAVKTALQTLNLSSVYLSDRANLFQSRQCQSLLVVLKAVLFVEDERLFNAALATELVNYQPSALYQLQHDEPAYQRLKYAFVALREQWQQQSFISMALTLMHEHFQLVDEEKDRTLTNILHLFELLQQASVHHHQPQALLYWFEQQCQTDDPELESELRLESEADLIKIVTQHGSKGLEYEIVFIPFACRHRSPLKQGNSNRLLLAYHDEQGQAQLSLDGSEYAKQAMADEQYAESVRLLYVAVTRAKQRCYVLSCEFEQAHLSPLGKTLQLESTSQLLPSLQLLAQQYPDAIGVEQVFELAANRPNTLITNHKQTPHFAKFTGRIERDWWLSSFTALTRNSWHDGVSLPDRDQSIVTVPIASSVESLPTSELAQFQLTKGANTGNLLHAVLEHADFSQPQWLALLARPLLHYGELNNGIQVTDLVDWLQNIVQTPLPHQGCLADLTWHHTLREVEFYYPMQVKHSQQLSLLLAQHRGLLRQRNNLTITEPVASLPSFRQLRGMMHGFIDLIFEANGKFYVCDYKSSHLGEHFGAYTADNLLAHVEQNFYDLQSLIYALALHRYLTDRKIDYQVSKHFGGVYYLYLRGMSAQPEYRNCGVCFVNIDPNILQRLDQLFDGAIAHV